MSSATRQRRIWFAVATVAIVGFLALGYDAFTSTLTPYVGFDEARAARSPVQINGSLAAGSTVYAADEGELRFTLLDEGGAEMPVVYGGTKPGNFEEATMIVAIGSWDGDAFHSEKLLVKCPSKYQGVDGLEADARPAGTADRPTGA